MMLGKQKPFWANMMLHVKHVWANIVCQEAHWGKAPKKNVKEHQDHNKNIKMLR